MLSSSCRRHLKHILAERSNHLPLTFQPSTFTLNFPFFIAQRFFRNISSERKSASNPTITIATAGVAVGLCVMIITLSVISGFQREITKKVTGFASDIELLDLRAMASPESFPITADQSFVQAVKKWPGVERVDRVAQKMGIFKTDTQFQGINLKGVETGYDTTFIASTMVEGRLPRLTSEPDPVTGNVGSGEVAISQMLAQQLELKVGDRVFAYFFEESIRMRRFKVVGIYSTNMAIFDQNFAITDFATVSELNHWTEGQCSVVEVRLQRQNDTHLNADADLHAQALQHAQQYCAQHPDPMAVPRQPLSIREHYQQVFSWLDLLDFNMIVIIVLMVCVAGFTMISGLLILILERTQTIGVLKALGATNARIRYIFLNFAALITLRGLLIGNVLALALMFLQQKFGFVHLDPANYYIDTVPVAIDPLPILVLNVLTLVLTTIALVAPSYMISHIQPAKAIRYE